MSFRNELSARLSEIPFRLARGFCSRQELAKDYKVDAKTISRDIDTLSLQYPIIAERRGREVFYGYADDFKFEFPKIPIEELGVLLLARKSIEGIGITTKGSFFAGHADSLLERIRASLPTSVVARMNALAAVYGLASVPAKNFSKHTRTIDRLSACAVSCRRIQIGYHGLNSDKLETRIVEPYAVYFDPDGATLKFVARDVKKNRVSVFSVERIEYFKELKEEFKRPAGFDLKDYLDENCFNGIHGNPVTVRLKATGITARVFAERKFHSSQKTIGRKQRRGSSEETITIEMRVAAGRGLVRFILSWLPDIEIISPAELREEVRKTLLDGLKNL